MIAKVIPAFAAAAGVAVLAVWLGLGPGPELQPRLPVERTGDRSATSAPAEWQGRLERLGGKPADLPGLWDQFRGPNRDNISPERVPLASTWPDGGPPLLWEKALGQGHAGAAVRDGRVYVLDHDAERQADVLRCMSLADGRDIWRYAYPVKLKLNHGMSRTVPAVSEKHVVSLGPKGHVLCLDATTGEHVWHLDLVRTFGARVPDWYAGQCPLIDGGRAVIAPGGPDALMIAVDCADKSVAWQTPNPRRWGMTHSSVAPATLGGRRAYVYCATGGVVGVSADNGRLLWQTDAWRISIANVPTPLPVGDGRILLTGGYNAGAMMLRVAANGSRFRTEEIFRLKYKVFGAPQHTPILYRGHVYGVRQDGQLVCLDLDGQVLWSSGTTRRFGLGPYLIADGKIFIMDDDGTLSLLEATPERYHALAQAKVLEEPDAWGPMAIAGGRLILRDLNRMICLDVAAP